MFYNKVEVKAIVLAVYNIESLGLDSGRILLKSILQDMNKSRYYMFKEM